MPRQTITQRREEAASKAEQLVDEAKTIINDLFIELEEIKDNIEEKFSQTERFQLLEQLVDSLSLASDALEEAQNNIPPGFQYT